MMARHIKIDSEKIKDLKEISRHFEQMVDSLSDEQLDAVEDELQVKIRAIIEKTPVDITTPAIPTIQAPNVIPLHHKQKKSSWQAGLGALAMAAIVLVVVQLNRPEVGTDETWQTKGDGVGLHIPCESKLVQGDRSSPKADLVAQNHKAGLGAGAIGLDTYAINSSLPTYLNVSCPQAVFVHVAQRQGDGWKWLARNQRLEKGIVLDNAKGDALNLTPSLGTELRVLATGAALADDSQDPELISKNNWSEELKLEGQAN